MQGDDSAGIAGGGNDPAGTTYGDNESADPADKSDATAGFVSRARCGLAAG